MPKLFVVGDQKNLAELASVLLRARTSATARESALEAIRHANPSLDFDRIAPGTVVVVPPFGGAKDASSQDPLRRAADDLVTRVEEGVASLVLPARRRPRSNVASRRSRHRICSRQRRSSASRVSCPSSPRTSTPSGRRSRRTTRPPSSR